MTLLEMRKAAGLKQKEVLAGYPDMEMDIPLYSKIERGKSLPTESFLLHACAVCGYEPPDDMVARSKAVANASITKKTRRAAYDALKPDGKIAEILRVWEGVMIPRDVLDKLPYRDMNAVRPRISEMKADGILEPVEKRRDRVTGMLVAAYRLAEQGK